GHCRHAAACERAERFRIGFSDRSSVRGAVGWRDRQRSPAALRQCVDSLRLVAPFHCNRHRAFRQSRDDARGGDRRRRREPRRRAGAGRRTAVHPRRAGMDEAPRRGGTSDAPASRRQHVAAAGEGIARTCRRSRAGRKIRKDLKMAKREVKTDKIRTPSGVFSQATVIEAQGRLVFISGMTARRPDGTIAGIGDITMQTRQVCENGKSAVEAAGGTLDDVCRVDVYVRNMEHFKEIHAVRQEYFKPPLPASTMVEICKMTSPDYLIEINAIAVIPSKLSRPR